MATATSTRPIKAQPGDCRYSTGRKGLLLGMAAFICGCSVVVVFGLHSLNMLLRIVGRFGFRINQLELSWKLTLTLLL
jgi:hypothetical protein